MLKKTKKDEYRLFLVSINEKSLIPAKKISNLKRTFACTFFYSGRKMAKSLEDVVQESDRTFLLR